MDINQFNRLIRSLVNPENAQQWLLATDKKAFCTELIGQQAYHEVVLSILVETINELLERKAEDLYATYLVGDGVSILENGHCTPATVVQYSNKEDTLVVQLDRVGAKGEIEQDRSGTCIDFHRTHDQVYVHMEGRTLSRLVSGRKSADYSAESIEHHSHAADGEHPVEAIHGIAS